MKINTGCWVDGCKCFDASDEDGVGVKRDRQWVGLTDEEIEQAHRNVYRREASLIDCLFADELETKLKEKNETT